MAEKRIPQRKCVACNTMKNKKELIRIVRAPDGNIALDITGKASGRGAYICRSVKCLDAAYKAKRFEKAFGADIPDEVYKKLRAELENSVSV